MEPKVISKDALIVVGKSGGGLETGETWQKFMDLYDKYGINEQISNNEIYKVKIYYKIIPDALVGMISSTTEQNPLYNVVSIPAYEYAIFDAPLASYTEQLKSVDNWIRNNEKYKQGTIDGCRFLIEYYGSRYDEEEIDSSVIEIWVPLAPKE